MWFGLLWMKWMEIHGFTSHMFVLVNMSPTLDFEVGKMLRQGDSLSLFLFVLVVEELDELVKKAKEVKEYQEFINKDLRHSNLLMTLY